MCASASASEACSIRNKGGSPPPFAEASVWLTQGGFQMAPSWWGAPFQNDSNKNSSLRVLPPSGPLPRSPARSAAHGPAGTAAAGSGGPLGPSEQTTRLSRRSPIQSLARSLTNRSADIFGGQSGSIASWWHLRIFWREDNGMMNPIVSNNCLGDAWMRNDMGGCLLAGHWLGLLAGWSNSASR